MRPMFTDKAAKALHIKVIHLLNQRNEMRGHLGLAALLSLLNIMSAKEAIDSGKIGWQRICDLVTYFGSACSEDNLSLGIQKVVDTLNDLADKDHVTGAMCPLSIITLDIAVGIDRQHAVVSYVALTDAGQKYAKLIHPDMLLKEGEVPMKVGDQR